MSPVLFLMFGLPSLAFGIYALATGSNKGHEGTMFTIIGGFLLFSAGVEYMKDRRRRKS